jgi:hypothetical protein
MASSPTAVKRQKERERQERQREKDEKRKQRRAEKSQQGPSTQEEDPDIAGIVPGPQPVQDE